MAEVPVVAEHDQVTEEPTLVRRRFSLRRMLGSLEGVVGLLLTGSVCLVGLVGAQFSTGDPMAMANPLFLAPSSRFPMGTDAVGREVFPRVVQGIGTSLSVVVLVMLMSTVVGITAGALAGYRGGVVDSLVMRLVDVVQAVPRLLVAIVVVALLGSGLDKLVLLLGLTSWTFLARLVRAEVLSLKRREFVESARAAGASGPRILLHHVLPNVLPAVLAVLPLMASQVILIEAALAFLGLSDQGRVSLGFLIAEAQPHLQYYWWLSVFPGAVLVALVLGLNLAGQALSEILNPVAHDLQSADGAAP